MKLRYPSKDLKISEGIKEKFRVPWGKVFPSVKELRRSSRGFEKKYEVFVVGDFTGLLALKEGLSPRILVFDGKVERKPLPRTKLESLKSSCEIIFKLRNPPSTISKDSWRVLKEAIKLARNGRVGVLVEGEEDLLAFPLLLLLRVSQRRKRVILYGIRRLGVVKMLVNKKTKEKAKKLYEAVLSENR